MTTLNLEKFGFTPETYGLKKNEIFDDIEKDSLPNTNFLIAGDLLSGKTLATKLAVLRQYKEKEIFIYNPFGEYNRFVNSLNGVIITENFNEVPDSNLILYDLFNTKFDGISDIVNNSLKNLFKNFNKDKEKLLVIDDIYLLDLQFFNESEILKKIVKNSKSLDLSVIIVVNPFKYTPRGLFYLNSLDTWHAILENTAIKACFRPGAMLELGFHDCESVIGMGEGYLSYPVKSYGNVPFSIIPTDEETKTLAETGV